MEKTTALDLLSKGKATFAQTAEIAKLSLLEFADLVKHCNVEWVPFEPEDVEKEFKEASKQKRSRSEFVESHFEAIFFAKQELEN